MGSRVAERESLLDPGEPGDETSAGLPLGSIGRTIFHDCIRETILMRE